MRVHYSVRSYGLSDERWSSPASVRSNGTDGREWTTYTSNDSAQRHSTLTQITPANVDGASVDAPDRRVNDRGTPLEVDETCTTPGPTTTTELSTQKRKTALAIPPTEAREKEKLLRRARTAASPSSGDRQNKTEGRNARWRLDEKTGEVLFDVEIDDEAKTKTARSRGTSTTTRASSAAREPRTAYVDSRGVRCQQRQEGLAILDRTGARATRLKYIVGRLMATRRQLDMGDRRWTDRTLNIVNWGTEVHAATSSATIARRRHVHGCGRTHMDADCGTLVLEGSVQRMTCTTAKRSGGDLADRR